MSKTNQKYIAGVLALAACLLLIVAFGGHTPVEGQHLGLSQADNSFTDNITAASDSATISLQGAGAVSCYVSGTFSATLKPQISYDGGTTYIDTQFFDPVEGQYSDTITAAASRFIIGCAGASHARVADNASYSSGTAVVVMRRTTAPVAPDPVRDISVVKAIQAVSSAADATIWTPGTGKKVRIMGISIASTVATTVILNYEQPLGTVVPLYQLVPETDQPVDVDFGPKGFLCDTTDATIYVTRAAASILSGAIWGREEDLTP